MRQLLARVQGWWQAGWAPARQVVPYEVACACGHVAKGLRQPRHQVIPCTACGKGVFVLPYSPLPPVKDDEDQAPAAVIVPVRRRFVRSPWMVPIVAALVTLGGVVAGYALLLSYLNRPDAGAPTSLEPSAPGAVRARVGAGQKALAAGNYRLAVEEFRAAQEQCEHNPDALPAAERRQLATLLRQAELLADLLSESLQEILGRAVEVPHPEEWQAQFANRYKGRAVVFDDVVRQDEIGGYHLLDWGTLRVGGRTVRVELGILNLPALDSPQRLLFGARLASIAVEAGGVWVVRFAPDSAVLLTDPGAITACCPVLTEAEVQEITQRQAERAGLK